MNTEKLYSVNAIPPEYKKLFGRDTDIFEVVELLPIVLRGCHAVPPEYVFIDTTTKNCEVVVPCVYFSVKYACSPESGSGYHYRQIVENGQGILVNYNMDEWRGSLVEANGAVVINQVEPPVVKLKPGFSLEATGRYVNYRREGNVLKFERDNIPVHILLAVMQVDEKGYPMVTEKVVTAMAYFLNMVYIQKKYYAGQVPQYLYRDSKDDYSEHLGNALTPEVLSDNEINDIMNALSTYHRHQYNQPFRYE